MVRSRIKATEFIFCCPVIQLYNYLWIFPCVVFSPVVLMSLHPPENQVTGWAATCRPEPLISTKQTKLLSRDVRGSFHQTHWDGTSLASDEANLSLLLARPDYATLHTCRGNICRISAHSGACKGKATLSLGLINHYAIKPLGRLQV
jgi:hypothetical protein